MNDNSIDYWKEFSCAVDDLKNIVTGNTSFDNFDVDDLKNLMVEVHKILHILNVERSDKNG